MGREVRRVPKDWVHPKRSNGTHKPLDENYTDAVNDWESERESFYESDRDCSLVAWAGERPNIDNFMPDWEDSEKTHLQMYETTTEGTPISPVCETPEELARWLADNKASAFGSMTASYESWLDMCKTGFAPSMVVSGGEIVSGVEFCRKNKND